jgi:cytoskeletal protein RodZ
MTTPQTGRRPSRRTLLLGGAALALVVVVVVLIATLGGSSSDSSSSAGSSTTASPATTTVPAPATSAPPPTPTPTGPTESVDALPSQESAVGLQDQADTGDGVTARLTDVSVVQATAQGPGSVSGRALRVTVELTNGTSGPVSFSGVDVNADTGEDHVPAPPVVDGETEGVGGTAAAGAAVSGTYLFSLPDDENTVTVLVGYQAGAPLMVFTGSV